MRKFINPHKSQWVELTQRTFENYDSLEKAVKPILRAIKRSGDKALSRYVKKYDGVHIKDFLVSEEEFQEAQKYVSEDLKKAIQAAKYNIAQFHLSQRDTHKKVQITDGVLCWQKSVPISKVGLYIPSRHAPLFSTIMMLGIPANIAGCQEIILCSTPNKEGKLHPIILYTAYLLNIKKVYKIGGVQAIGAMAYGTESIPKVYKIFGPSNQYVTAAKQLVGKSDVAIDLPSGPSELMIFADHTCNPHFVATDILANLELGEDTQNVLITTSEALTDQINAEVRELLEKSHKKATAQKALQNAKAMIFESNVTAIDFINDYAPEHLALMVENDEAVADKIINAGAVHLGNFSPETADYASGINNILPTNRFAKAYSGISIDSFVKNVNFQKLNEKGFKHIAHRLEVIAEAEELPGRKASIEVRREWLENQPQEVQNTSQKIK